MSNQRSAKISMTPRSIVQCRRNRGCTNATQLPQRIGSADVIIGLLGLLSVWLYPQHHVSAQIPAGVATTNSTTYEDDRIKVIVQQCNRKLQDLICQATLTSKNSDRIVNIDANNVKLVDFEGNEYYPSLLKLANRTSENNLIRTELVENVPFKASFIFSKIPTSVDKIALLQIQLSGGLDTNAKFRNIVTSDVNIAAPIVIPTPTAKTATSTNIGTDRSAICPDNTKIMYRATSKHYAVYICGTKNPTHYVGLARDGSQGITLRLRYYDRTQFSADNGNTNYAIADDRLTIRKDNKVIYRQRIQVLQPLAGTAVAESPVPKTNLRKSTVIPNHTNVQKRSSTPRSNVKIERRTGNNE
jgi:hypothetical protein